MKTNYNKSSNSSLSTIIGVLLVGIIIVVGLMAFNIIDNPITGIASNDIQLTTKSLEMRRGEVTTLDVINDSGDALEFISNDPSIVSVNEITGYVKANKAGTAIITISLKNHKDIKDDCTITVIEPVSTISANSITLSDTKISLQVGGSKTLHYTVSPSNATVKKILWSTSNKDVATIDKYGKVTGIGVGTATIKIKTDNEKIATCTVTVAKKSSGSSTPTPTPTPSPTPTTKKYTLTYNANGGSVSPTNKTLNEGEAYGTLPTPTRSGYTFIGWYTQSSGGAIVTTSSKIYNNTTIYAHWSQNSSPTPTPTPTPAPTPTTTKYTIEYKANGGTGTIASHTCEMNGNCTIKSNSFTRSGYTFNGWTTNSNGSDDSHGWTGWSGTWKYTNGQYGIANNKLILYAMWKQNSNGGSSAASPIVPSSSVVKYEGPTLKYYVQNKGSYYLTYIWMQNPYNQIKKLEATTAKYGKVMTDDELTAAGYKPLRRAVGEMMNDYIKNGMIPKDKAAIAFNASAFFDNRAWVPPTSYYDLRSDSWFVVNDGKVTRKIMDDYASWKNQYRVIIGITSGGNLGIYGVGASLEERQSIVSAVSRDGVKNTFTFRGPVLVGPQAWASGKNDAAKRQAICQINSNNYLMLTATGNYKIDSLTPILKNAGCTVAFNLDGGGSTTIYYKKPGATSATKLYVGEGSWGRSIVEGIYFTE